MILSEAVTKKEKKEKKYGIYKIAELEKHPIGDSKSPAQRAGHNVSSPAHNR